MFEGISNMTNLLVLMLASLLAATATAQKVTPLLTKPMPEQPGRQIEVITVDFAPGARILPGFERLSRQKLPHRTKAH
jgi:hypothetical protein